MRSEAEIRAKLAELEDRLAKAKRASTASFLMVQIELAKWILGEDVE